jgi:GNAT superfamily N-acetyltransferase
MPIGDLSDMPHLLEPVAQAVWTAFWQDSGRPLSWLRERAREALSREPVPFCLVAHRNGRLIGTASVIASDLAERPDLTPWLAAVLVNPAHRRKGIGAALVTAATERAFATGAARLHLYAARHRRAFYRRLGWSVLEEGVPTPRHDVLFREP